MFRGSPPRWITHLAALILTGAAALVMAARAAEPPDTVVAPPDLLGHWTFDTDTASTVGGWTAELQGGAQVGQAGGLLGGCYRNGAGEGYLLTDLPSPDDRDPQTVSLWLRTDAHTGANDTLFGWGGSGFNGHYDVGFEGDDLHFLLERSSATLSLPTPLGDGEWHHLLLSFAPGSAGGGLSDTAIYVDGKSVGSPAETFGYHAWRDAVVQVGTGYQRTLHPDGPPERDYNGSLDDFALFDSSLSAAEAALVHGLARVAGTDASGIQSARQLVVSPRGAVAVVGDREWTRADSLPGTTGDFGGSLETGDAWIALDDAGGGIRMLPADPEPGPNPFTLDPTDLNLSVRSGDRANRVLGIARAGAGAAAWELDLLDPAARSNSLEALLGRLVRNSPEILGSLPEHLEFAGGVTGTQIDLTPGEPSPYNGGNILETDLGGPLEYSDGVVAASSALGADGRYFTLKLPGLFLFGGDFDGASWFDVGGRASSQNRPLSHRFSFVHGGRTWQGFAVIRSSGPFGPAVNELYLVDDPNAGQNFDSRYSTPVLDSPLSFSGKRRVLYAAFAVDVYTEVGPETFEPLALSLVRRMSEVPPGTSLDPSSGTLDAGGSTHTTFSFDAFQVEPGTYPVDVEVQPAGGGAEAVRSTVQVTVEEPAIRLGTTAVDRAGVVGGPVETVAVPTSSTTSADEAWSARLIGAGDWVTLVTPSGTTPDPLVLRFTPPSSGGTGMFRAMLEVTTGTAAYQLPVSYSVDTLSPVGIVVDPLRNNVYALNRTGNGGAVVVYDPNRNRIRRVIRTGPGPSDVAFSPDGATVYLLSAIGPALTVVDASTLEVTRSLDLPGVPHDTNPAGGLPSARVATGPGGRIYYTDSDSNPALRLLDLETGGILDTVEPSELPMVNVTRTAGFADIHLDVHEQKLYFTRRQSRFSGFPRIGVIDARSDDLEFAEEFTAQFSDTSIYAGARLFSDLDRRRFYFDRLKFDRDAMTTGAEIYDDYLLDVSAYGEVALTRDSLHDALTGEKLVDMPFSSEIAAFSPNQNGVVYFADGAFGFWSIPAAARPRPIGVRPTPADGSSLELGDGTLSWTGLPLVEGYRVYIGADRAALEAAGPGSPEDRGVVTGTSYTMDPPPASGTFYWRVDALRGDEVLSGPVFSFSVAPFRVTPREIDLTAPSRARPQQLVLEALDGGNHPVAWSLSSPTPWIRFPMSSGTAEDPLEVELVPGTLAVGSHSGLIRVTAAGLTIDIPVLLRLFEPDLSELASDPNRPVIYGLDPGILRERPGHVVGIDPATGDYLSSIPLESYATDLVVHPHEDRLYVSLGYSDRIEVIDLSDRTKLPPIEFDPETRAIHSLTPGQAGRLYAEIEGFTSSTQAHVIDTSTGMTLGTLDDGYASSGRASGATDAAGGSLYRVAGDRVQRLDVSTDEEVLLESADTSRSGQLGYNNSWIAVSRDGSRVVANQVIFTAELQRIASTKVEGQAITGDGELVVGPAGLYWADTGFEAAPLPLDNSEFVIDDRKVALSADDRHIVVWDEYRKQLHAFELASLVDLPGPVPRPGQRLETAPDRFSWGAVDGATEYRVFLGTNESVVIAAGTFSPSHLGTTETNAFELGEALAHGDRYFWRVDALTPGGLVKGTVEFFDLPFQPSGNPILQPDDRFGVGGAFGTSLVAFDDGLAATQGERVLRHEFDAATGEHRPVFDFRSPSASFDSRFGKSIAAGKDLMIVGDPQYEKPVDQSGAAFVHVPFPDGFWHRERVLPDPPDESLRYFGNEVAYGSNQLLVQQGSLWQTSGRVFSYFEWPDWERGGELVPNPRQENDFFGASIALDGSQALVGAPGSSGFPGTAGGAFYFEYESRSKRWRQMARLIPQQGEIGDSAGLSLALAGNHAALGSGDQDGLFGEAGKVHVFFRRSSSAWIQKATLEDPENNEDSAFGSQFGKALAIHGDLLFVSAPYAEWRGQEGGVVYPYRYNGSTWEPLAPLVPPPGGGGFGTDIAAHDGWLFVSFTDRIVTYRIDEIANRRPRFVTAPPIQFVAGQPTAIEVESMDPDGNGTLSPLQAILPPGLSLTNLGNGRARIEGSPSDPAGTERWIHLSVADDRGNEAVQTAKVEVLAADDLPLLAGIPSSVELEAGEDLRLVPEVQGSGPFQWQWRKDGADLPAGTDDSLEIPFVDPSDSGEYTLAVTNAVGTTTSGPVRVVVRPADRTTGDWTSFAGGNARDGHQPVTLGRNRFQAVWSLEDETLGTFSSPLIVGDRLFVCSHVPSSGPAAVHAFDLDSGDRIWSHELGRARRIPGLTWHDGRIYVQVELRSEAPVVKCLDAGSGAEFWRSVYASHSQAVEAPAVSELGVFAAGYYGNLLGAYDLDGSLRYSVSFPNSASGWTPALSSDGLFVWLGGEFSVIDPSGGSTRWSRSFSEGGFDGSVPAIKGSRAYFVDPYDAVLRALDLDQRSVLWSTGAGTAGGSPSLGTEHVFAGADRVVRSFRHDDGSPGPVYSPGDLGNDKLSRKPLVLNDHLITSSSENVYVFDLGSPDPVQVIERGGELVYGRDRLVIAGFEGGLTVYRPNAAPAFAGEMPDTVDAPPEAGEFRLAAGDFAVDPDSGESLTWSLIEVSRPELFNTLAIDPGSGDLTVVYNPWQSGASEVTLAATDSAGNVTESTITFTVPELPLPELQLAAALTLNRQTGLYEHRITVTNPAAREIAGFDLAIDGLPAGVLLNNASGSDGGTWFVQHRQPLAAGASLTLVLDYYTPVRGTVLDPGVSARLVTEPESDPAVDDPGLAVDRCERLDDGLLIEFTSIPGALYEVHYSADNLQWKVSPTRIRAAGNRTQWIDRGPPRTDTPPADKSSRFYRVVEVEESATE